VQQGASQFWQSGYFGMTAMKQLSPASART